MDTRTIASLRATFEEHVHVENGVEFWYARELQKLLEYEKWENFVQVIERAKLACRQSKQDVKDHFPDVRKMVRLGSGSERSVDDYKLSRYACYLIAQNGDPRKESIAFAQTYFAVQTRKQEVLEQRIAVRERLDARERLSKAETELSKLIYERGVDGDGFARIRSKGDEALFGGKTTAQMKKKLGIPVKRPVADFLPTVTITAKNLATEITNHNVTKEDLRGEPPITSEHVKNNTRVRGLLKESGIIPEELPPAEDVKKIARNVKQEGKRLVKK